MTTANDMYELGIAGQPCWIGHTDGTRKPLPVSDWIGNRDSPRASRAFDAAFIGSCTGPTIDLGCGPGRFVAALGVRGIPALGVDRSSTAVGLTRSRGGAAVLRDVFRRLPGDGRWTHALLADGNIGIGGDPVRLLTRTRALIDNAGTVIVEVEGRNIGVLTEAVRLESGRGHGRWFPWSRVGLDGVHDVAAEAGLAVKRIARVSDRHFAVLRPHID